MNAPARANFFRLSTIRVRLMLAFSRVAVLLVVLAGVGTWRLAAVNDLVGADLRAGRLMGQWLAQAEANAVRVATRAAGLRPAALGQGLV